MNATTTQLPIRHKNYPIELNSWLEPTECRMSHELGKESIKELTDRVFSYWHLVEPEIIFYWSMAS